MLGADAGSNELISNVDRMRHIDREGYGAPALAMLQPVAYHVADQFGGVHARRERGDDVVALLGAHALGDVLIDWGEDPCSDEEAEPDQFRDLRRLDHRLEDVPEPAPVAAARRGGEAEEHGVRVQTDQILACASADAMTLVEDDDVGGRQPHGLGPNAAREQRVYGRHLHHRLRAQVPLPAGQHDAVHAQRDPVGGELAGGLVDDLATMRQEQHTLMPIRCTPRDLGGHHRLAGAGRRYIDHTTHAARYLALDLI